MRVEKYDIKNTTLVENDKGETELKVGVFGGEYIRDEETQEITGFESTGEVIAYKQHTKEYIENAIAENTPDGLRLAVWQAFLDKYNALSE